jgi:hypothetical protein
MYDNGMSPKVASARCMPANPRPEEADDFGPLAQGDSHV